MSRLRQRLVLDQGDFSGLYRSQAIVDSAGLVGQLVGLEGDSQPLGYSVFDATTNAYVERADHPMSTANPDELGPGGVLQPKPLSPDAQGVQQTISEITSVLFGDACVGGN